jgi:hypothetical protein
MKRYPTANVLAAVLLVSVLPAAVALVACGGSGSAASGSSSATPRESGEPVASPTPLPSAGWWEPGTDSAAVTAAVARRWHALLRDERFAASRIWAPQVTFDLWASDVHESGGAAVQEVYVGAAPDASWKDGHELVGSGVVAWEGLFAEAGPPTAALDLLAVSGGKITHEEVYFDASGGRAAEMVTQWPSPPTSVDTVAATRRTAAAFARVLNENTLAVGRMLPRHMLFYDTAQKRQRRRDASVLTWWGGRTAVSLTKRPADAVVAGRGWAVIRWSGTDVSGSSSGITLPGAAVLETRSGKVVRLTLYYDSATLRLHL